MVQQLQTTILGREYTLELSGTLTGYWLVFLRLLVALAIVGLAFAPGLVSAHGIDTTADDVPPYDGTPDDWAAWMESHTTDHMGPGSVEWMESHMGVTVNEMGQDMANGDYGHGHYGMYGPRGGC